MRRTATGSLWVAALALALETAHAQETPPPGDAAAGAAAQSASAAPAPKPVFELLDLVKRGLEVEKAENRQRVERFKEQKDEQERLLAEARETLAGEEAISQQLEARYNEHEVALAEAEARLTERLGQLGELFGVVRQVSTDMAGIVWDSLTSAQLGQRQELLERLGRSKELPSTEDLESLWYELHREMTQQGEVVRFQAPVLTIEGQIEERDVVRAGPFSAVSRGRYLLWEPAEGKLRELGRQPPSRYVDSVEPFESAENGVARLAVDPSRGSLLNALTDTPSARERIAQGGTVGYVTIVLGVIALVLGVSRWVAVSITSRKVAAQQKRARPDPGNPLGRVLSVFEDNREADPETLELKLDEAVMRESSRLERFQSLVKTISVVAPLLGLLGTVTGMIKTFQAITMFGAGDPKMMASGISEALVTTMIGLIVAIPLVLLYDMLSTSTQRIVDVLDEQSAGILAERSEAGRD